MFENISAKKITIGKTHYDRYSQKAIGRIKEAVVETPINEIWTNYKNR